MRKALIPVLILLWTAMLFAQSRAVGIVTQVKGEAKIQEPGAKTARAVEPADLITEGTRITVAPGGVVSYLFCPESVAAEASAGSDVTFGAKSVTWNKGSLGAKRNVPYCRIPVMDSPQSASGARAATSEHLGGTGVRGGEDLIVLVTPVRCHEVMSAATLRWKTVNGADKYLVQVKSDNGAVVFEGSVSETKFVLPESAALKPDTLYRWRVTAMHGEDVLGDASTWFKTLSAAEQTRLAEVEKSLSKDAASQLMLASLLEELDMPVRAQWQYQGLKERFGTQEWFKKKMESPDKK